MKNITSVNLAVIFAGCFLGAGFVSGQELWQYFGAFGLKGFTGMMCSVIMLCIFGFIIVWLARKTGETEPDKLIIMWDIPILRAAVTVLQAIFMFAVVSIMTAGIGELIYDLFGLSAIWGGLIFTVVIMLLAMAGLKSILSAFSISVPLLVLCTLAFGVYSAIRGEGISPSESGTNALIGGWFAGSVNYACYNIFSSVALLAPFGVHITKEKTVTRGLILGGLFLAVIASSVLICIFTFRGAEARELPMLYAAGVLGKAAMYVYGFLLFAGMFGTSLSNLVALVTYFGEKSEKLKKGKILLTVIIAAASFLASRVGFGDLIGMIYPVFGYASAGFMALMTFNFIRIRFVKGSL